MIRGRKFVIFGLSRLTTGVVAALSPQRNEVVVLHAPAAADLLGMVDSNARLISVRDRREALREAGLENADSLLALADDDLENLHAVLAAHEIAPHVPVVVRTFDPTMADALEQGLNVRRAFSVSALSAPAFVAAVLADDVVETLMLRESQVLLCSLTVRGHSPLVGETLGDVERGSGCAVIGYAATDEAWRDAAPDQPVAVGDRLMIGGLLEDVLQVALRNSRLRDPALTTERHARHAANLNRYRRPTLLPAAALALLTLMLCGIAVFSRGLNLAPIDALYFVVTVTTTTGFGDISLLTAPVWVKLFGCVLMFSGAGLLAVLFSHLAAVFTADRLREQMGRRAQHMHGHVVMSGLGNIGYRVEQILNALGIDTVVIEQNADPRFAAAVGQRSVILTGDGRLPDNLLRASIETACAFVANTDDDLANIQAALQARKLNARIHTVSRVFDIQLTERLTSVFRIDCAVNPIRVAVSAFVGAATDERAMRRLHVGDEEYVALRHDAREAVADEAMDEWRTAGIHVLALLREGTVHAAQPHARRLHVGDAVILAGPEAAVRRLIFDEAPAQVGPAS